MSTTTTSSWGEDTYWSWLNGTQSANQRGHYGMLGIETAENHPGGRGTANLWTAISGDVWLFGGSGFGQAPAIYSGWLNDLWKYSPATEKWTWMKGSSSAGQLGTYGSRGVAAVGNTPGGRHGGTSWRDGTGDLWLYGGYGFGLANNEGYLNDLWKFDPATVRWVWLKGSTTVDQIGRYPTMGVATSGANPGGRKLASSWVDTTGSLWLFGGYGFGETAVEGSGAPRELNDLWKYDPSNGNWAWIKGSSHVLAGSTYGIMGLSAPENTPGSRLGAATWTDLHGNLWLFGGMKNSNLTDSHFSDLWQFNPILNNWTWVQGSKNVNRSGVYGTQGVGAIGNSPGGRDGSVAFLDEDGNLCLFGGHGYGASNSLGELNDLWKYDVATGYWSWMQGSDQPRHSGSYGDFRQAVSDNIPSAREFPGSCAGIAGDLWLYGGNGLSGNGESGYLNDLWKLSMHPESGIDWNLIREY